MDWMREKLGRVVLPALVVVITGLSILVLLQSGPAVDGNSPSTPGPALGSPTLVFVVQTAADPQAVGVRLAGRAAVIYGYAEICGTQDVRPPKFILPLVAGEADAILARARSDPDVADPMISVWPCGAGM